MIETWVIKYLNYLFLAISTAFVVVVWAYVIATIWRMLKSSRRDDHRDPLENVKFSAISSLTHIALIGGFVFIATMVSAYVYSARSKNINQESLGDLKDIVLQIIMLVSSIVSGLVGYMVRGEAEKIKNGHGSQTIPDTIPYAGGQGSTNGTGSPGQADLPQFPESVN